MASVVGIAYYPVKGCAGVTLMEATLTPDGLLDDRSYAVADAAGGLRWQGEDPRLALITPELRDGELTLRAPGTEPLRVTGDGAGADAWLTGFLGSPSRLVRPPAANASRLHLVSLSCLDALNVRITERGAAALPVNRFRPNLVIDGPPTPHTGDDTPRLTIASTELAFAGRTVRCAVTMVDQETGRRAGPEPLRTLADHRRAERGVVFGAYFAVLRPGRVRVGDEVTPAL
ncbi:MOSC N-terminal beta barrel domain-containing protein [Streptomyces sp. NPDC002588]|uniref:MOSC domain-containing protein n=1 Tax=Streptomyces sp. NPDC002588 TaxID=3154419 RepID=UPI003322B337